MTELSDQEVESALSLSERLYAPVEVAFILNLRQGTVQEKCRTGEIKATKLGTQWRISASELRRYLREGPLPRQEEK